MLKIDFPHRQFAHCESGVIANLLDYHGFPCSEALAFGIGSGLFFAYVPFVKINYLPLTTFRSGPGSIFRKTTKRLGIKVRQQKFKDRQQAEEELDRLLAAGVPVGTQVGVYWLPFFPPAYRFHFNAHNLVVFGKDGDEYLISDPIFEETVRCPAADLRKARFAKGALAPHGRLYYIDGMPERIDVKGAARDAMLDICQVMLKVPVPLLGVRGIRLLARQLSRWPERLSENDALQYLGHVVRMQEEIGTGGGGFRFIYAAFLQEVAQLFDDERYLDLSQRCTAAGDLWREFAVNASRLCKGRAAGGNSFAGLAAMLRDCAAEEEQLFRELRTLVKGSGR